MEQTNREKASKEFETLHNSSEIEYTDAQRYVGKKKSG